MKKIYLSIVLLGIAISVFAQAPQKMSYQSVIRDANNLLVKNQVMGVEISILQGTINGMAVYSETQSPASNANGLISLEIGMGTPVNGVFSEIDWSNGPYFIKTQTDPTGGTNYTITGTRELLSVPYALHAAVADKTSGHYVGEFFGGGMVFFVWDNGKHGLIVCLEDLANNGEEWGSSNFIMTGATNFFNGRSNTTKIVNEFGSGNYAAKLCDDYTGGGFTDWYLPSITELKEIDNAMLSIQRILSTDGNSNTEPFNLGYGSSRYWSSTERLSNNGGAWAYDFANSGVGFGVLSQNKITDINVRAIREF